MQSSLYIKICGITNPEDAGFSILSGVDAIGFILYPKSPRYITPDKVKNILDTIEAPNVRKVGVFVDEEAETIMKYIDAGINTIQLHGNESASFAEKFAGPLGPKTGNLEVWKVIKPQSEEDIKPFAGFPADKFLIDAFHKDLHGGTGLVLEPEIAKFAVDHLDGPVLLAGGISPKNCVEIFQSVKPFGLDVNSGVEISPGIKDHNKIEQLFKNLRKSV